jgi:pimeloyl-ACP methyl ester carboxylesterase
VAGPNRAHDQVLLAAPLRTGPGEYTATLSATSPAGEKRATPLTIVVKPRQTVPSGSTRPPVVLLNGWETGFTGTCTVSSSSADTFGNLAEYLVSDGVPVVYFFDNCAIDPNQTIEGLGNDLATYLNTIQYDNGDQVPQIDLVAFSMGGLIARAYLAGLQPSEIATPPATTLVRDLILIATPNFGSFVAGNYLAYLGTGTQSAELVPGSSFLWNLATWNQRGDDLRGVNALAIIGNAGQYLASLESTTQQNNASDGLVSETSAALGFALLSSTPTQIVPYCHVDPSAFTNTTMGTFYCDAAGIANVTSDTQETGEIVRSFLAGTTDWQSIGGTPA